VIVSDLAEQRQQVQPPVDLTVLYNPATLDAVGWRLAKAGYRPAVVLNGVWQ